MSAFWRKFRFLSDRKRYRAKITPSGYIFILITIAIGIGAVNTGNNLLYLLTSMFLGLMALSGLISLGNLFFLDVSVIPPRDLFADVPAPCHLHIHKRRGHAFFLNCDSPMGSVQCPFVQRRHRAVLWLTFPERGRTRLQVLNVHSGFPLGFFKRILLCPIDLDALVYPTPMPCLFPALSGEAWRGRTVSALYGEMGDEIKELRAYRPPDPLKWIDWKATARRGETMARDFYRVEGDTLCIDLSGKGAGWERRLSEACYLIIEADRKRLSISLRLPDREFESGQGENHKRDLLEALALA